MSKVNKLVATTDVLCSNYKVHTFNMCKDGEFMNNQIKVKGGVVHKTENGFVISDAGGWLAGSYDSVESATLGIKNRTKDDWSYLNKLRDEVNINHGRNIQIGDFK